MPSQDQANQFSHEYQLYIKANQEKFDYAFATLCFAALALSLQFSTRPDSTIRWVLIVSWVFYLFAALLGGWRLMTSPQFDKINHAKNRLETFVRQRRLELKDPAFLQAVHTGNAGDDSTGEVLTLSELQDSLRKEELRLSKARTNLGILQKQLKFRFNASVVFLLLALTLNGVYLATNFMSDATGNSVDTVDPLHQGSDKDEP